MIQSMMVPGEQQAHSLVRATNLANAGLPLAHVLGDAPVMLASPLSLPALLAQSRLHFVFTHLQSMQVMICYAMLCCAVLCCELVQDISDAFVQGKRPRVCAVPIELHTA